MYCTECPKFSITSQDDLNYHIAKKHKAPKTGITSRSKLCSQEFSGLYVLRQHKTQKQSAWNSDKVIQQGFGLFWTDEFDDTELKEELRICQHSLVDSELEKGVFIFNLSAFHNSPLNETIEDVFTELKDAAKVNLALGFVLKSIENGTCRYFYAHENKILEKSKSTFLLQPT